MCVNHIARSGLAVGKASVEEEAAEATALRRMKRHRFFVSNASVEMCYVIGPILSASSAWQGVVKNIKPPAIDVETGSK